MAKQFKTKEVEDVKISVSSEEKMTSAGCLVPQISFIIITAVLVSQPTSSAQSTLSEQDAIQKFVTALKFEPLPQVEKRVLACLSRRQIPDAERKLLLEEILWIYDRKSAYTQEIPYFDQLLNLCGKLYGSDSNDTAQCLHAYAACLRNISEFEKADALDRRADLIEIASVFGKDKTDSGSGTCFGTTAPPQYSYSDERRVGFSVDNIGRYRRDIMKCLSRSWCPLKPNSTPTIRITINRQGKLLHSDVVESSGNKLLDQYTLDVLNETEFPPLPESYRKEQIELKIDFAFIRALRGD